ncbi:MAG TPA: tRNA preQ1(34) S-adenosylmethionine ribosyltransferase-isomerase QueA [Bryobacteraceae bacterium]|nr:tRNA preQ1(34) S-adenosylmethionine ribosyltransferase-isomerase QueA [Bryobacteraceae bacterium]
MQVSDFHYELPPELIAQEPAERGTSRMLVVSRQTDSFRDDEFRNFSRYIRPDDCLVLNDTRVFPARLHGHRNTRDGAAIEVLLVRPDSNDEKTWRALVKPAKRARTGDRILFSADLTCEILEEEEFGERIIRFETQRDLRTQFEQLGEMPLPPYIHRKPTSKDSERYQTVFARETGSVAAPTAGLHFTQTMLDECRGAGAEIARVTLHVGLGTFAPLRGTALHEIALHEESFELKAAECEIMRRAKRLLCVGTTSVRTLETAYLRGGLQPARGETNLFIYPGFHFQAAGSMLTNFHLPESSLLLLVAAFAGRELMLAAYQHAVRERYRFFSYGDCMLIE